MPIDVKRCTGNDAAAWHALRAALWPDTPAAEHAQEIAQQLADSDRLAAWIASINTQPVGLAEVALRSDYVNGTETSPVLFLEGLYVVPAARRRGVARALVGAAAAWGRVQGCCEFASDAQIDNAASHALHRALGFAETERVVYFRQLL